MPCLPLAHLSDLNHSTRQLTCLLQLHPRLTAPFEFRVSRPGIARDRSNHRASICLSRSYDTCLEHSQRDLVSPEAVEFCEGGCE